MASNIKFKRSAVQNRVPTAAQLELGELALNTYDGKLYTEINTGSAAVVEIGSKLSSLVVDGANGAGGGDVVFHGTTAGRDLTWDYSENRLEFPNHVQAAFGDSAQLKIYHDQSNGLLSYGTGTLFATGATFRVVNNGVSENIAWFKSDAEVELYYNNALRFETTQDGADIFGTGSLKIPVGTTAQRSSSPTNGDLRYNTTTGGFEGYSNNNWGEIGAGGIGIGSDASNPRTGIIQNRVGVGFTDLNIVGAGISVTGYGTTVFVDFNEFKPGSFHRTIHNYTATAGQTTFAGLNYEVSEKQIAVYLNGARLSEATYTATSGTTVVLDVGASVGDEVEIINIHTNSDVDRKVNTYTATAGQTTFTGLSYNSKTELDVYLNGIRLASDDFTATSGNTVVLAVGASVNDTVDIVSTGDGVTWRSTTDASGDVYKLTNVGIGTDQTPDKLNVRGNVNIVGVLTATTLHGDGSNLTNTGSTLSEPSSGTQRLVTTSLTTGTMTSSGTGSELAFDYANNHLEFSDGTRATFGAGNDLQLYHTGSHSHIQNYTGEFRILGNQLRLKNKDNDETYISCDDNGAVDLYYDNVEVLSTNSVGVFIRGTSGSEGAITLSADANEDNSDKFKLKVEDGGPFKIQNRISGVWETNIECNGNGNVELYHNNTRTFQTTSFGAETIFTSGSGTTSIFKVLHGNLSQGVGIGYHSIHATGSNTDVQLKLMSKGSSDLSIQTSAGENMAVFRPNESAYLYFNNSQKFKTTNTGVSITGNLAVSGVLTYDDVTNVDSVGIITARAGVVVSSGTVRVDKSSTVDGFMGEAYSGYFGLKHTDQTLNSEYMILSQDTHTFISASSGSNVYIRGGGNSSTNEMVVSTSGTTIGGNLVLTTANEGSGNGLDADTLDGVQGSSFLRSNATDTASGAITFTSSHLQLSGHWYSGFHANTNNYIHFYPLNHSGNATQTDLRAWNGSSSDVFRISGGSATGLSWRGNTIWTAENDGSGSGLDADTLDGAQGSQFLRSDSTDTCSGQITFTGQIISKQDGNKATQGGNALILQHNSTPALRANHFIHDDFPTGSGTYYIQVTESSVSNDRNMCLQGYGGKVKIGGASSAPTETLHVQGTFRTTSTSTFEQDASFNGGAGAVTINADSDIRLTNSPNWSGESGGKIQHHASVLYIQMGSSGLKFRNTSGTDVLTIANDGHFQSGSAITFDQDATFNGGSNACRIAGGSDIRLDSGTWTGNAYAKIQHHSDRLYIAGGSNTNPSIVLRYDGNDQIYMKSNGTFYPVTDSASNLGESSYRWANVYADSLNATATSTVNDVLLRANAHLTRSNHHSGHLEGSYNNVGANTVKSNPIYTIGSSYNPNDADLGTQMYGIGFTHRDATFINSNIPSADAWGLYIAADGDARIFLSGTSGNIWPNGVYGRTSHHKGHLQGSYNNIGDNSSKSNPIYTIGSNYNPTDAALSNMYGIGYTHANASFISGTGATGWGLYVAADGDARIFFSGSHGTIQSTGDHYVGSAKVWHNGNDGSGTGLDADTLDGVQGASFLRSDASDSATQPLTFSGGGGAVTIGGSSDIRFSNGNWTGNAYGKIQQHSNYLYIAGGTNGIIFREDGTDRWHIDGDGHFRPSTNGGYDLGTNSVRVRNINASGIFKNNARNETPDSLAGAIYLQPSSAGGNTGIIFNSKTNANSDCGYIWWYDDNGNYIKNTGGTENGTLVIGIQNDGNASSEDAIAIESSGDIFLNPGNDGGLGNAGGATGPDFAEGKVYVGRAATKYEVFHAGAHSLPDADNTYDLGSSAKRFRFIYTTDLQLSNENTGGNEVDGTWGNYTIQEGEDDLFLINRRNGKKYKFNLTEVS